VGEDIIGEQGEKPIPFICDDICLSIYPHKWFSVSKHLRKVWPWQNSWTKGTLKTEGSLAGQPTSARGGKVW